MRRFFGVEALLEFFRRRALFHPLAPAAWQGRCLGRWPGIEGAELLVGQIFTSRPGRISFVEEQAGAGTQPDNLIASGAGGVLFLPVDDRIFAVSSLLRADKIS